MNFEKLDNRAMMMIVLTCTAIVLGVLVIDMQIAKNLAARAQEIDDFMRLYTPKKPMVDTDALRRYANEVARSRGTSTGAAEYRNHSSNSVERNSGVEAGTNSEDTEIPMEGWDVFPVDRSAVNGNRRIGNLEVPQSGGTVEP